MNKMIWFDVDDVLVDTAPQIEASLRKFTGKHIPHHTWPHLAFSKFYGLSNTEVERMREHWKHDQILEKATLFDGVVAEMNRFVEDGYNIGLITARAWHPEGESITWNMVVDNAMPVKDVVVTSYEQSKMSVLKELGVDVSGYIDDSSTHIREARALGIHAALVRRAWNSTEHGSHCILGIHQFHEWLNKQKNQPEPSSGFGM